MSSEGTVSNMKDCFKDDWETVANSTYREVFSDQRPLFSLVGGSEFKKCTILDERTNMRFKGIGVRRDS